SASPPPKPSSATAGANQSNVGLPLCHPALPSRWTSLNRTMAVRDAVCVCSCSPSGHAAFAISYYWGDCRAITALPPPFKSGAAPQPLQAIPALLGLLPPSPPPNPVHPKIPPILS